jgi:hypothetical protein
MSRQMKRTMCVVLFGCLLWAPRVGERDRTESVALAVVRAIVSGELAHASRNEGYFDTLPCLESGSCSPGQRPHVPSLAPDLVERHFTSAPPRSGYRFEFHPGPSPEPQRARDLSPSAMTGFAVVAIPLNPQRRHHSFCGDGRGTIYMIAGGAVPRVEAGRCVETRQSVADFRPGGI